MQRILIVDTDRERRSRVTFLLQHMGYAVDVYSPRSDGPQPDVVLLSEHVLNSHADDIAPWMLRTFGVPKLVLGNEPEEVAGVPYLEMGADAYLPAPLDLRLLLARVRAVLKRKVATGETVADHADDRLVSVLRGHAGPDGDAM